MPTNFYGKANATYFIARFSNTNAHALTNDTAGNIYVTGNLNGISILYTTSGSYSGTVRTFTSVSGATFVSGFTLNEVYGAPNGFVYGGGQANFAYCCSNWDQWGVTRMNTSGVQNITNFSNTTGQANSRSMYVDSSNNAYSGSIEYNGSTYVGSWVKLTSSLGVTVGRTLTGTDGAYKIKTDSANNIYVAFRTQNSNTILVKYNSSGTLQWQRRIGNSASSLGNCEGSGLAIDSSDNIYVAGRSSDNSGNTQASVSITKLNSSGTVQWQRRMSNAAYGQASMRYQGNPLLINAGTLTFTALPTAGSGVVFAFPLDGTKTGSYPVTSAGTWVYSVDTIVPVTTSTFTDAASAVTMSSLTVSTPNNLSNTNAANAVTAPTIVSV